ncbi:MAG: endo alpha-1,4 polygalactosaminidase [Myxococcales bacterium]|nr:endo alpha-1,4 polygalactosaminidase [Myxococcales bacterium]
MNLVALLALTVLTSNTPRERLITAERWAYQLQGAQLDQLIAHPCDVIVIDAYKDVNTPWSFDEVAALRKTKVVLAYLSVGEAEDYRPYWDPEWSKKRPDWIGRMNPQWRGNYPVQFWRPEWWVIISKALDDVSARGFDGVYLDRVDVFEEWGPKGKGYKHQGKNAPAMSHFILSLVNRARTRRPDFLVVPQNAPTLAPSLAPVVNAWAVEDAFFMGNRPQPKAYSRWLISALEPIRERRLPILSVDYMTKKALVSRYRALAERAKFIPLAAPSRELDRLD